MEIKKPIHLNEELANAYHFSPNDLKSVVQRQRECKECLLFGKL